MAAPIGYAPPHRRFRGRWAVPLAGLVALAALVVRYPPTPTSGDIRLDTGDVRYRFYGVPVWYERTSEPQRTQLLAVAARSTVLTPEWYACVKYPLASSNNTDAMCRGFYRDAALWIPVDPGIAQLVIEDVARYVRRTAARTGLPDSVEMISPLTTLVPGPAGVVVVKPDWRDEPEVQRYLQSKGYAPSPPSPIPGR